MPNIWSGANWKEGQMGKGNTNPGAVGYNPKENTLLDKAGLLGLSAVIDGSGSYFSPSSTKQTVGGETMQGTSDAMTALKNAAVSPGATEADQIQLKRDFDHLASYQGDVKSSKDYGKLIYNKGDLQFGDAPKGGILANDVDNKYTDTSGLKARSIFDDAGNSLSRIGDDIGSKYGEVKSDASNWLDKHNFWRD